MVSEPIFHRERPAVVKSVVVSIQASLPVVGVHSLGPAVPPLRFQTTPGKFQPWTIKVGAQLVGARHPDHDWSRVCDKTETLFTFPQWSNVLNRRHDQRRRAIRQFRNTQAPPRQRAVFSEKTLFYG